MILDCVIPSFALLDHFFKALEQGFPATIPLREGLCMALPGICAEMSSKQGDKVPEIRYPRDK